MQLFLTLLLESLSFLSLDFFHIMPTSLRCQNRPRHENETSLANPHIHGVGKRVRSSRCALFFRSSSSLEDCWRYNDTMLYQESVRQ